MSKVNISVWLLSLSLSLSVAVGFPLRSHAEPQRISTDLPAAGCDSPQKGVEAGLLQLKQTIPNHPGFHYQWGQFQACQANFSEAIASYKQAISLDPKFAHAYLELGKLHASQQDWEQAIAAYEKVIDLDPKVGEAYPRLAMIYTHQKRSQEAEAILKKAIPVSMVQSFDGRYSDVGYLEAQPYLKQGMLLLTQGKLFQAEPLLRRAVSLNPSNADAALALSELLVSKNDPDAAINVVEQTYRYVLKRGDTGSEETIPMNLITPFLSHAFMANHFMAKGDLDTAIYVSTHLQTLLTQELQSLSTAKETKETVFRAKAAVTLQGQIPLKIGTLLVQQGKESEAVEQFRTAIKTSISPFLTMSDLFSLMAEVAAGKSPKEKSKDPDSIESQAYKYLGDTYLKQNSLEKSSASYQKAVQFDPSNQGALSALAHTQLKQNLLDNALVTYQQVVSLIRQPSKKSSNSVEETAIQFAASELLRLRQFDQAIKLLESGQPQPLSKEQQLPRKQLIIRAMMLQKKHAQAETILQEIIAEKPENLIYLYNELVNLQIKQDKLSEAELSAKSMIKQFPKSSLGFIQLSRVYSLQNKPDLALASFYPPLEKSQSPLSDKEQKIREMNARSRLANTLKTEGKLTLALGQFQALSQTAKAAQEPYEYYGALYNMADIYIAQEQGIKALPLLNEIIGALPVKQGHSFYRYQAQALLAKVQTQQGQYGQAIAAYRDSNLENPVALIFGGLDSTTSADVGAYSRLGKELSALNRSTLALHNLDLAIQLQPDASVPRQWRGEIHEKQGNLTQASQDYQKAIAGLPDTAKHFWDISLKILNPNVSNLYTSYGRVLLQQNKPTEAKDYLEQALQANPANPEAQTLLQTMAATEEASTL